MDKLEFVIPIYNEQENLEELFRRLIDVCESLDNILWQVIYVNDGSDDGSLEIMMKQCKKDSRFSIVDLSRNFGHQAAIAAGLAHAAPAEDADGAQVEAALHGAAATVGADARDGVRLAAVAVDKAMRQPDLLERTVEHQAADRTPALAAGMGPEQDALAAAGKITQRTDHVRRPDPGTREEHDGIKIVHLLELGETLADQVATAVVDLRTGHHVDRIEVNGKTIPVDCLEQTYIGIR